MVYFAIGKIHKSTPLFLLALVHHSQLEKVVNLCYYIGEVMNMATDKPRFTITLDPSTLDRVLEYKDENGISTQSKAIQKLIEIGIADMLPYSSRSYPLSSDEKKLVEDYQSLSKEGKQYIRQTMVMAKQSYSGKNEALSELDAAK